MKYQQHPRESLRAHLTHFNPNKAHFSEQNHQLKISIFMICPGIVNLWPDGKLQ